MVELKNKKTGRIVDHLSNEDYAEMVRIAPERFMKKFEVINLSSRVIIPSIKPKKITLHEG